MRQHQCHKATSWECFFYNPSKLLWLGDTWGRFIISGFTTFSCLWLGCGQVCRTIYWLYLYFMVNIYICGGQLFWVGFVSTRKRIRYIDMPLTMMDFRNHSCWFKICLFPTSNPGKKYDLNWRFLPDGLKQKIMGMSLACHGDIIWNIYHLSWRDYR